MISLISMTRGLTGHLACVANKSELLLMSTVTNLEIILFKKSLGELLSSFSYLRPSSCLGPVSPFHAVSLSVFISFISDIFFLKKKFWKGGWTQVKFPPMDLSLL